MRLTDLQPGRKARILDTARVSEMVRRRLIDLGIMEGSEVCVKRILPLGGPITMEAGGQLIGIRRKEAGMIEVSDVC